MKKLMASIVLVFMLLMTANVGLVCAVNVSSFNTSSSNIATSAEKVIDTNTEGELKQIKEKSTKEVQDYAERYGSETYGLTAYILDKVRIYSIPLCFIGIAVGAIYQYVIGIRKLDVRDRGFGVVIAFVTLLIICQILPLIFAIVVKGWRG